MDVPFQLICHPTLEYYSFFNMQAQLRITNYELRILITFAFRLLIASSGFQISKLHLDSCFKPPSRGFDVRVIEIFLIQKIGNFDKELHF